MTWGELKAWAEERRLPDSAEVGGDFTLFSSARDERTEACDLVLSGAGVYRGRPPRLALRFVGRDVPLTIEAPRQPEPFESYRIKLPPA